MTDTAAGPAGDSAQRTRAIAAELSAAGLATHVHQTGDVLDVTAVLHTPGRKDIEVIVDEDLCTEIRYWNQPDATPAQVASVIVRALTTITRPS
jgi:hypothetical protein